MTPPWIEAMRLRTLPVSVAGVVAGCACAVTDGCFRPVPAVLCLVFAVLAQIASNFANEYFDFKAGFDTRRRVGPRRGVSCGDITPRAMLLATAGTLALACAVGCALIFFGGWWLLPAGIFIALGALAYSAGPYPLSRHCLGEVAVVIFFGIVPVNLTYYVQSLAFTRPVLLCSIAMGLLGAMVIMCNNYRDIAEDRRTGKRTVATVIGHRGMAWLYLAAGAVAYALLGHGQTVASDAVLVLAVFGFLGLSRRDLSPDRCTKLLAITSLAMLLTSILLFV